MKVTVLFLLVFLLLVRMSCVSTQSIHSVAKDGNVEVIEELIKKGENINSFDEFGWTPLMWASYHNHHRLVEYLLNNGANVNNKSIKQFKSIVAGSTALHIAAYYDHVEVVRTLLNKGADSNIPDSSNNTALNYADMFNLTDIYELLTGINLGKLIESIRTYNEITIGWLDLNEERWKEFGYNNKEEWIITINNLNQQDFPNHFKKLFHEGKKISFVSSKNASLPKNGLIIQFSDVQYVQHTVTAAKVMFLHYAGADTLDTTIHFIDGKTGKEIYRTKTTVNSIVSGTWKESLGLVHRDLGFEGRLYNCLYNLVDFLSQKLEVKSE